MSGRYTPPRWREPFDFGPVVGAELVTVPEQLEARRACRCFKVLDARGGHLRIRVLHEPGCPVLARVIASQS